MNQPHPIFIGIIVTLVVMIQIVGRALAYYIRKECKNPGSHSWAAKYLEDATVVTIVTDFEKLPQFAFFTEKGDSWLEMHLQPLYQLILYCVLANLLGVYWIANLPRLAYKSVKG